MAPSEEDGVVEEKESKKKLASPLATAWLTFYNIAMTAGWLVLAVAMIRYSYQKRTHKGLYRNIQKTLKFFQTFALLEIVHCGIGIVRTSVLVTGVQVLSRIFMVWFVVHSIRPIQPLYHLVSDWCCWWTPYNLCCLAFCEEIWPIFSETSKQVQCLLRLLYLSYPHNDFVYTTFSTTIFPYASPKEEGASWRGDQRKRGLNQSWNNGAFLRIIYCLYHIYTDVNLHSVWINLI